MQRAFFNDKEIIYTDIGEGDVIVLLHGYLGSSRIMFNFARKLASGNRVISIDLPGHGFSDVQQDIHSMELMAEGVKKVLDVAAVGKAILVGHSMGGYVTLAFLELYPEMVAGYCLFHSHPLADSAETIKTREREIKAVKSGKKNLLYPDNVTRMYAPSNLEKFSKSFELSKDIASRTPGDGILAVVRGMMTRPSRVSVLEAGKHPCLWLLGTMDSYIDHKKVTENVKLPANASMVLLENSGHLGFIEEEDLSATHILNFAAGIFGKT